MDVIYINKIRMKMKIEEKKKKSEEKAKRKNISKRGIINQKKDDKCMAGSGKIKQKKK